MKESELILQCQQGSKSAFHELISHYYPYVTKFLLNLTQNTHLTEDLTQDTFIRLINSIDKYNPQKASFATYLMTIAKNLYIDYIRKTSSVLQEELDETLPSDFNLEDTIIFNIDCQAVASTMKSLPLNQSNAINLKYLEQFSLNEIADRFGCESKTVKSRIHNGMVSLRRKICM